MDLLTRLNLLCFCYNLRYSVYVYFVFFHHLPHRLGGLETTAYFSASKKISSGLVCNGYTPVTFAMVNDAKKTAKYLAKKSNIALVAAL